MSSAFIATPKVRHVAVWGRNHHKDKDDPRGMYRAICGEATHRDALIIWPCEATRGDDAEDYFPGIHAAMSRPVCRRCLMALDDLNALLGDGQ